MMKYLLLLACSFSLYATILIPASSKQILLVSSEGFNNTKATLKTFERSKNGWHEVFEPVSVNLGRKGLAWGKGVVEFSHQPDEPLKIEGDGKSPAGLFRLGLFFGYDEQNFGFPYLKVGKNTLCIDDSDSLHYNKIIESTEESRFKSFEYMKREDRLYRLGITVKHNEDNLKRQGSCIFIHIQRAENSPTSGCTSMQEAELLKIMKWLKEESRPLLLQLPSSYLKEGFD